MLKAIDKVWFWIQDHVKGYDKGYLLGYEDGTQDGMYAEHFLSIQELKNHEPVEFSDASFKLGYQHAIAVLKEDI